MLRNKGYLTTSNQLQNVAGSLVTEKYGMEIKALMLGVHEYCYDLSGSLGVKAEFLTNLITTDSSRNSCSVELDQHTWRVKLEKQVEFLRNLHQPDQDQMTKAHCGPRTAPDRSVNSMPACLTTFSTLQMGG